MQSPGRRQIQQREGGAKKTINAHNLYKRELTVSHRNKPRKEHAALT